jgi:hypothetical protein
MAGASFPFDRHSIAGCDCSTMIRLTSEPPSTCRTVTGAPSGVTSFVVVGANAGESKLRKIAEKKVPTIDEDGFLDLIRLRGSGKLDDKQRKKAKEEEAKIKRVAQEMEDAEREADRKRQKLEKQAEKERQAREQESLAAQASASGSGSKSSKKPVVPARPAAPTSVSPPFASLRLSRD